MPRRREVSKRRTLPDPVYKDAIVAKLINDIMYQGKKSTSESIVYGAFKLIQDRVNDDPVKVFKKALENVQPVIEVKSRRVGGSNYQVPVEVRPERRLALGLRWLIGYARDRKGKPMEERLAGEILDAASNRGGAVKKREDVHKMAEANKAFAHYKW